MKTLANTLERILRALLCVLVVAMTLTVLWQVGTRLISKFAPDTLVQALYGAGLRILVEPSQWTEELAGFLLGWVALLGAAYVFRRKEHLGFDLLWGMCSPGWKRRLDIFAFLVEGLFCGIVLVYGGVRLVALTFQLGQTTAALGWPMGVVYLVIPLSGLLMTVFSVDFFIERLRGGGEHAAGRGAAT